MISPPESHTQANAQFEETTVTHQPQLYQEQGYVTSERQPPLLGGFAPGAAEWSLGSGCFSTAAENNPTSVPNMEVGISQDMSMFMDSWEQNWANVNPNDTQGADGDWDSLLPHA